MSWNRGWRREHGARSRSPRRPLPSPAPAAASSAAEPAYDRVLRTFFIENRLSALEISRLASSGQRAGARGVEDFASIGASGRHPQNMARDLFRHILRGVTWPAPYWLQVPARNKDGDECMAEVPVLLVHECLQHILEATPAEDLARYRPRADREPWLLDLVTDWCAEFGLPSDQVYPIGFHGDGVPYTAKMGDSMEQMSWNFGTELAGPRVLFAAVPKSLSTNDTFQSLLQLFAWSMRCMVAGAWPTARHDLTPFGDRDKARRARAGQPFRFVGALLQVRADWDWLKKVLKFPGWGDRQICWRCHASRENFRHCGPDAPWRTQRRTGEEFVAAIRAAGRVPSPLLGCPGLRVKHFVIDWMHCVDLGIAQDCLGQLFWDVLPLLGAGTRKQQVRLLWMRIRAFYQQRRPRAQLQTLTEEMVRLRGKPPKLRSKAGECRYLIPFGAALAAEFADGSEYRRTVARVCALLLRLAELISAEPLAVEELRDAGCRFAILYSTLGAQAAAAGEDWRWRPKPKLHMLQELCEYQAGELQASPRDFWNYVDESWCGWIGDAGGRRGGAKTVTTVATNIIQRFRASAAELVGLECS